MSPVHFLFVKFYSKTPFDDDNIENGSAQHSNCGEAEFPKHVTFGPIDFPFRSYVVHFVSIEPDRLRKIYLFLLLLLFRP